MLEELIKDARYSREELWNMLLPGQSYPSGGSWNTGYYLYENLLFVFADVVTPGRSGCNFPSSYDPITQTMEWYGKPNSHSAQPTFRRLFRGELKPLIFVRWDTKQTLFTYLGVPRISSYTENCEFETGSTAIKLILDFSAKNFDNDPGPDGEQENITEGGRITVTINKFERDPRLKTKCLDIYGPTCRICGFDFFKKYGPLGKDYCHVHHIVPLSEVDSIHSVNPAEDLIPVCPNCHAMLHRKSRAITPDDLREMIELAERKISKENCE